MRTRDFTFPRRPDYLKSIPLPEYDEAGERRVLRLMEKGTKFGLTSEEEAYCSRWVAMRRDALREALQEGAGCETLPDGETLEAPLRPWVAPTIPTRGM